MSTQLNLILNDIGLNEKEVKIYLALLELHEALPGVVSKKAGVKRPTTYVILEQLQKKGLVSHFKRKNITYFRAVNPKQILEEQKRKLSRLESALPELTNLHEKYTVTPQLSLFEGRDGLIQIMEDTLTTSTELLCWANPQIVMGLLEDYYPSYIKKKVEKQIFLKGIFCYDEIGMKFKGKGEEELREVYLIPKEKFPFKNEINIYDDKVAIISHQDGVGVIIQNKNIADTQRAIFNLGFEYARLLERDLLSPEDKRYLGL
ncbi:MAG: helix-turn-helix domain-containing protein [Candidatus Gracilibacteria bacterium]|jgi:sugar-specific transcriptional regulator TrmB